MKKHRDNERPIVPLEQTTEKKSTKIDEAGDTEPDTIFAMIEPEPLEELLRFLLKPDNKYYLEFQAFGRMKSH